MDVREKQAILVDIKLTHKKIEEMCGTSSLKKGVSFFRANKVTLNTYTDNYCEATVTGNEDFQVSIERTDKNEVHTSCSCPSLASFSKNCQHIAAVLLAIADRQQEKQANLSNQQLAEGFINMFDQRTARPSGRQRHFEDRQVLSLGFNCEIISNSKGQSMIGIGIQLGAERIQHVRDFLSAVGEGNPYFLPSYDPELHCFTNDKDAVLQQLIQVMTDENVYVSTAHMQRVDLLPIPTTAWQQLLPLLTELSDVTLHMNGKAFVGLRIEREALPIQFSVKETNTGDGFLLEIDGLNRVEILTIYQMVLFDRSFMPLDREDMTYLGELKQMLHATKAKHILITTEQVAVFMENVVPRLRKLGSLHLSAKLSSVLTQTPLRGKLYLDRVKNRLLASIEFHYENIVINPLENRPIPTGTMIIRDREKEEAILQWMKDSQFAVTEEGYYLHNEALEYEFLYHKLPKLQKLVNVYATSAVRARVIKSPVPPRIKVKAHKDRMNWLEFKFEIEGFPEQDIRDLLATLEEKRKYYRLRDGSLLTLETSEFEEIQRFLQAVPNQDDDLEAGLHVPVTKGFELLDAASDTVFTLEESFRQFLKRIENPDLNQYPIPARLQPVLREYQKRGFRWMKTLSSYGFGGVLADDMGLGKTMQSMTFIQSELNTIRKRGLPVLVICPSSLTYNWLHELNTFTPEIQAAIIDGNQKTRVEKRKRIMGMDVVITSYPLLRRDIHWFEKQLFHTIFFDEAQAFKNPVTQTARVVKKLQADYRFALTGTPMENNLEELWSIFHVVFPVLFQGLKDFHNLTRKQIVRRMRPFLLRRIKKDVLAELPEKMEAIESIELLPDQKRLYAAYLAKLRQDTLKHLDRDTLRKNRIKILAGLTRLRQICCHPGLFVEGYKGSSAKLEQLKQLIKESSLAGRRVLIFSQFTKMLDLMGKELVYQGIPYFYLDGETPSKERLDRCRRFNMGERDFFLISMKAGGTGLNLTGADTVILYDMWWNPAVEQQAADRAHRMGQENVVQVIKLVSKGTIEEKMNELQAKKKHLIEEMIDPQNKSASSITEEDIREILMF